MEGLGINIPSFVAQLINFGILFGLLMLVAYKPVMKMFDERTRKIRESIEQTEKVKQQMVQMEEAVKKRLEAAAREGQELIAKAMRAGDEARQAAVQQARQEAEALLARAKVEIQREQEEAIGQVRKEFADLTIMAASKVIDRSLDREAHRELIEKVLAQSETLKKG